MVKGGSANQQTRSLMQLLGGATFVVGIVYGLYIATRDPVTWGNAEWLGTIRVIFLLVGALVFFAIADSMALNKGGKYGKGGYHGGHGGHSGHGGHGGHGYSSVNAATLGTGDLTDEQ